MEDMALKWVFQWLVGISAPPQEIIYLLIHHVEGPRKVFLRCKPYIFGFCPFRLAESRMEERTKCMWFCHKYLLLPTFPWPHPVSYSHRKLKWSGIPTVHILLDLLPDCSCSVLLWGLKESGLREKGSRFATKWQVVCTSPHKSVSARVQPCSNVSLCVAIQTWEALGIPPYGAVWPEGVTIKSK